MCLPGNSLALQLGGVYLFILPKGPVGFAVALFVFGPCRYPKAELRAYQSISVVKHDLSAGRAAGISQVGVGVVDGESTQTWQGDRDTAEAGSGGRTARGTARGGFRLWLVLGAGPCSAGNTSAVGTSAGTGQNGGRALPPSPSTGNPDPAFQHSLGFPPALSSPGEGRDRCVKQQRTCGSEGWQRSCPATSGHVQMCTGCRGRAGSSEEQPSVGAAPVQPG